jgi:hypothetical protein
VATVKSLCLAISSVDAGTARLGSEHHQIFIDNLCRHVVNNCAFHLGKRTTGQFSFASEEYSLATTLPPLVPGQPDTYDFDSNNNANIDIQTYCNDAIFHYNDCVLAARAHQTIRFDFIPGVPPLPISADDVTSEYFLEDGNSATAGVNLDDSLKLWRDPGWTAAGTKGRIIESYYGPLAIKGSTLFAGDPSVQIEDSSVMNYIYGYTGVQVNLLLPMNIDVRIPNSFGAGIIWKDTSQLAVDPHVMLLTGYNAQGPLGITWGQKQAFTWEFLLSYSCGIYVICKGPNT